MVAINDPFMALDYMVYQLKYDSVHGAFPGTVSVDTNKPNSLVINGKSVAVSNCKNPSEIPWGAAKADYVCESSGMFLT